MNAKAMYVTRDRPPQHETVVRTADLKDKLLHPLLERDSACNRSLGESVWRHDKAQGSPRGVKVSGSHVFYMNSAPIGFEYSRKIGNAHDTSTFPDIEEGEWQLGSSEHAQVVSIDDSLRSI